MLWNGRMWIRKGVTDGYCEHGNKLWIPRKTGSFLTSRE